MTPAGCWGSLAHPNLRGLDKRWSEVSALTRASLTRAILTEDVVNKIRLTIKRDTGCAFDNDTIQQALVDVLIHA